MAQQFQYSALLPQRREIRLLRFENVPNLGDQIQCRLRHASLDSNPEYTALSYTWGSPLNPGFVTLNGQEFQVTQNLLHALLAIRANPPTEWLWIDAISINQQDNAEKSWQVEQMLQVYGSADRVLIWLGPAADGSDHIMDACDKIGKAALDFGIQDLVRDWQSAVTYMRRLQAGEESPEDADPLARLIRFVLSKGGNDDQQVPLSAPALLAFLQRQWWRRVWVIQELTVARTPILACGTMRVEWARFEAVYNIIVLHVEAAVSLAWLSPTQSIIPLFQTSLLPGVPGPASVIPPNNTSATFQVGHRRRWAMEKQPLRAMLQDAVHPGLRDGLQCTDKRDMVYALLGLCSDADDLGITPDYTLTWQHVFTKTARAFVNKDRNLSLLSTTRSPISGTTASSLFPPRSLLYISQWLGTNPTTVLLPTWVPDWTIRPKFENVVLPKSLGDSLNRPFHSCTAALKVSNQKWDADDLSVLHIEGLVVGRITDVMKSAPNLLLTYMDNDQSHAQLQRWCQDMVAFATSESSNLGRASKQQRDYTSVVRTALADQVKDEDVFPQWLRLEDHPLRDALISCFEKLAGPRSYGSLDKEILRGAQLTSNEIGPGVIEEAALSLIRDACELTSVDVDVVLRGISDSASKSSSSTEPATLMEAIGHWDFKLSMALFTIQWQKMLADHADDPDWDGPSSEDSTGPNDAGMMPELEAMFGGNKSKDVTDVLWKRVKEILDGRFTKYFGPAFPKNAAHQDLLTRTNLLLHMQSQAEMRRMFKIDGGMLALGPEVVRREDVVIVAAGGEVPFVLRETGRDGYYSFLGECYVDGIMDGEWVESNYGGCLQVFKVR